MNKHDHVTTKKIPLVEKFGPTIQGEGATIGLQTYFLRFGLCDYACTMCDSMHAVDAKQVKANASWLTQDQICDLFDPENILATDFPTKWITLSGGNPCIHDLWWLVNKLKGWGYKIAVETQGTMCPEWLMDTDIITISPKGPGMGEMFEPDAYQNFLDVIPQFKSNLGPRVNTKVVIFGKADILFAEMVARLWVAQGRSMNDFFLSQGNPFPPGKGSPVSPEFQHNVLKDEYLKLFDQIKQSPTLCEAKWLPQFHVWLWANKQGV